MQIHWVTLDIRRAIVLGLNFVDPLRSGSFEKLARVVAIEFRIGGLDAEKETAAAG